MKTMGIEDYVACPSCGVHPVERNASGSLITPHEPGDRICLKNQIARLQAIVDKLPKTMDGVPVIFGDFVWKKRGGEMLTGTIGSDCELGRSMVDVCNADLPTADNDVTLEISECYSTREAAEAAQKGKEDD